MTTCAACIPLTNWQNISMRHPIAFLIAFLVACGQFYPKIPWGSARSRRVVVAIDQRDISESGVSGWTSPQYYRLRHFISHEMDATGFDFAVSDRTSVAEIVVRNTDLSRLGWWGRYYSTNAQVQVAEVDLGAIGPLTADRFQVVAHELMHYVMWSRFRWEGHICDSPLDDYSHCHARIGCPDGNCILSPIVNTRGQWPAPRAADLRLIRECIQGNCRVGGHSIPVR